MKYQVTIMASGILAVWKTFARNGLDVTKVCADEDDDVI